MSRDPGRIETSSATTWYAGSTFTVSLPLA